MKKKTAIVTGGTANDVPAMACLVMNIKDTNPNLADEIVIFHNGIAQKDQTLINDIFPTRFILYESPFADVKAFGDVVTNYFSLMVFCKYECFRLLDEYECVIWTDYDVVIVDDLSELKEPGISGIRILIAEGSSISESFFKNALVNADIQKYDLKKDEISMSLFSVSSKLFNYQAIYDWCIEHTKKWAAYLYLPEQAVVNLMLQHFNLTLDAFHNDSKCYTVHPISESDIHPKKILHAYCQPKFWNGLYNEIWEKNYRKWIKMGGTPYEHRTFIGKIKKTIYKGLRKIGRLLK